METSKWNYYEELAKLAKQAAEDGGPDGGELYGMLSEALSALLEEVEYLQRSAEMTKDFIHPYWYGQ